MPNARMVVIIATSLVLGGTLAGTGVVGARSLAQPLAARAHAALAEGGLGDVDVRFSGREATLSSDDASAAELAEARRIVARIEGVRWVSVAGSSAAAGTDSPHPSSSAPETDFAFDALGKADVLFAPDTTSLTRQASRQLIIVAGILADNPNWRVRIVGHVAVVVGGPQQAISVSTARAQAVADELQRLGVDPGRLQIAGVGADDPVADSSTPEGAVDNRRVTLELTKGP